MTTGVAEPLDKILQSTQFEQGDLLLCRHCRSPVTSIGERIEIGTTHSYRFTNPAGITFTVGCYRNAPGCAISGDPTDEDSWFGGYLWQFASCCECQQHLGWYYQSPKQRFFFGLIPERLVASLPSNGHLPSTGN